VVELLVTPKRHGADGAARPGLRADIEGIRQSSRHKSGLAVRFPGISRWRTDKKPEADTLAPAPGPQPDS
jgi:ATP-dependent DNA ligase